MLPETTQGHGLGALIRLPVCDPVVHSAPPELQPACDFRLGHPPAPDRAAPAPSCRCRPWRPPSLSDDARMPSSSHLSATNPAHDPRLAPALASAIFDVHDCAVLHARQQQRLAGRQGTRGWAANAGRATAEWRVTGRQRVWLENRRPRAPMRRIRHPLARGHSHLPAREVSPSATESSSSTCIRPRDQPTRSLSGDLGV